MQAAPAQIHMEVHIYIYRKINVSSVNSMWEAISGKAGCRTLEVETMADKAHLSCRNSIRLTNPINPTN